MPRARCAARRASPSAPRCSSAPGTRSAPPPSNSSPVRRDKMRPARSWNALAPTSFAAYSRPSLSRTRASDTADRGARCRQRRAAHARFGQQFAEPPGEPVDVAAHAGVQGDARLLREAPGWLECPAQAVHVQDLCHMKIAGGQLHQADLGPAVGADQRVHLEDALEQLLESVQVWQQFHATTLHDPVQVSDLIPKQESLKQADRHQHLCE